MQKQLSVRASHYPPVHQHGKLRNGYQTVFAMVDP